MLIKTLMIVLKQEIVFEVSEISVIFLFNHSSELWAIDYIFLFFKISYDSGNIVKERTKDCKRQDPKKSSVKEFLLEMPA